MVESVAGVSGGEVELFADAGVGKIVVVFEAEESAVGRGEFFDEDIEGADGFHVAEFIIGMLNGGGLEIGILAEGFALVFTEVIQGEVTCGAVEPSAWGIDVCPVFVEFEEGVLDNFLGDFTASDHPVGVAQQRRFLGGEQCLDIGFLRCSHAFRMAWAEVRHLMLRVGWHGVTSCFLSLRHTRRKFLGSFLLFSEKRKCAVTEFL